MMHRLTVRVDDDQFEALTRAAATAGKPLAGIVRDLINDNLQVGPVTKDSPYRCIDCNKTPAMIPEYVNCARDKGITPDEYVRWDEGTVILGRHFWCIDCYTKAGMPLGRRHRDRLPKPSAYFRGREITELVNDSPWRTRPSPTPTEGNNS